MATLGKILVTLLFVGGIVWVSVGNRVGVDFSLYPVVEGISVPLPILLLGALIAGFIWGAAIVWLNGAVTRRELRRLRKEVTSLEMGLPKKEGI